MKLSFDRWESGDEYSYAYRIFSKHHTFMNSLYWAHVPASHNIQYQCRKALELPEIPTTQSKFNLKGPNAFRVTNSISDYSRHLNEFDNWTRLNALVSVLAYFETYLSSVVSLAIESDLGSLHGVSKQIDGVMILKHNGGHEHSFFDKSEMITKGTWHQRLSNFFKLFKLAPVSLGQNVSDLEKMRKLRNNIAHAFGRDIDESRSRHTLKVLPIERLSEERLMRYMAIIREIAKDIDKQLLSRHIGDFELVHFYHSVRNELDPSNEARDLKRKINGLYVENKNLEYCKELIAYYDAL